MIKPLKKGDPVRVRLADGRVVDAEYSHKAAQGPHHWVIFGGEKYQTIGRTASFCCDGVFRRCRFVAPAIHRAPMGVSND